MPVAGLWRMSGMCIYHRTNYTSNNHYTSIRHYTSNNYYYHYYHYDHNRANYYHTNYHHNERSDDDQSRMS